MMQGVHLWAASITLLSDRSLCVCVCLSVRKCMWRSEDNPLYVYSSTWPLLSETGSHWPGTLSKYPRHLTSQQIQGVSPSSAFISSCCLSACTTVFSNVSSGDLSWSSRGHRATLYKPIRHPPTLVHPADKCYTYRWVFLRDFEN